MMDTSQGVEGDVPLCIWTGMLVRELASLDNEERRLIRVTRKGEFTAKYVLDEMKDIQRTRTDLNRQKAEVEASRRAIDSLDKVDESRIREVCAMVRENVGRLDHDGKLQALDALGARVVATSESAVLYGHLPSYVAIERTSGCLFSGKGANPNGEVPLQASFALV